MFHKVLPYFLTLLVIFSCTNGEIKEANKPAPLKLAESINKFTFNLYKTLPATGNIVLSPWSVAFALGMIILGSNGMTLKEMQDVMFLNNTQPENIHYEFKQLREHLVHYDNDYIMNMFSTILVQERHHISPVYKLKLQRYYDADIHDVNFEEFGKLVTEWINTWTSLKTGGKINKIMTAVPNQDTLMVLLTVNYFKGIWEESFNLNNTQPAFFNGEGNKKTKVDMMYATRNFSVYSGLYLDVHAIDVPMKGDISFLFMLPEKSQDMSMLQKNLSAEFFEELFENMEEMPVEIGIPKFRISTRQDLQDSLRTLGMKSLFSPRDADLTGISNIGGLFVDEVIHKAALEIDENGAIATSISIISIISRIKAYSLHFDRPFLFIIRDVRSGTILFMGRVADL